MSCIHVTINGLKLWTIRVNLTLYVKHLPKGNCHAHLRMNFVLVRRNCLSQFVIAGVERTYVYIYRLYTYMRDGKYMTSAFTDYVRL